MPAPQPFTKNLPCLGSNWNAYLGCHRDVVLIACVRLPRPKLTTIWDGFFGIMEIWHRQSWSFSVEDKDDKVGSHVAQNKYEQVWCRAVQGWFGWDFLFLSVRCSSGLLSDGQALRMYERCIELSPTSKNPSQNRLLALNYLPAPQNHPEPHNSPRPLLSNVEL